MGEQKYGCWLYQTVIDKDAETEWSRYVELPFVPYEGMNLQFVADDESSSGYDFTPHHVVYVVDECVWWCFEVFNSVSGCPCKPKDKCCIAKGTLEFQRKGGWELVEERRGKKRLRPFEGMFGPKPDHYNPDTEPTEPKP